MNMQPSSFRKDVLDALKIFADEPDVDSNYFNFDTYSNQLYDLLKYDSPAYSFAVCLNGDWGSGKTSLLRRVYDRFQKETETNDKINVIWFDAWQYERLDPVLALLQKIAFIYEKKGATKLKRIVKSLTLVSSDIVLRKTTGLSIEDMRKHFQDSVKEIHTLGQTLQNIIGENRRLIVFIDDLDRCSIENSLEILESIKLLFNAKNTKFVVAADMKKLETVWALKHKGVNDPLIEGREHLDKIFQLKLSLPSKISFSTEGEEGKANLLIASYLDGLTEDKKLPDEIKNLITAAFPPNPRKIKRALSLAYFIGKNLEVTDDTKIKQIFSTMLIWIICSLYFFELARLVREIPYLLPDVCLVIANTLNIGNLKLKLDNFEKQNQTNNKEDRFANYIIYHTVIEGVKITHFNWIEPSVMDFVKKVNDNYLLYRFLKGSGDFYKIPGKYNSDSVKQEDYKNIRSKIIAELEEVINSPGLISI